MANDKGGVLQHIVAVLGWALLLLLIFGFGIVAMISAVAPDLIAALTLQIGVAAYLALVIGISIVQIVRYLLYKFGGEYGEMIYDWTCLEFD